MHSFKNLFQILAHLKTGTVEPRYNEVLGTMKITLLYQVSHYIRVQKQRNIKRWDQQNYLVIRGFCYIRPLYNEVPLYWVCTKCMNTKTLHSFSGTSFVELAVNGEIWQLWGKAETFLITNANSLHWLQAQQKMSHKRNATSLSSRHTLSANSIPDFICT